MQQVGITSIITTPELVRFLTDVRFIRYVLEDNAELGQFWNSYLSSHHAERTAFSQAQTILLSLDLPQQVLTQHQVEIVRRRVKTSLGI